MTRFVLLLLASAALAVSPVGQARQAQAAGGPRIVKFDTAAAGALKISYSDGHTEIIPKTRRGSLTDEEPISQNEVFSEVQIAADHLYIGWMPQYMACTQNWPCTPELVLYRFGTQPQYIEPPFGIVWNWMFLRNGKQLAIHYGFPHGDADGEYGLYDIGSLQELARFSLRNHQGKAPDWVAELQTQEHAQEQ